MEENSTIDSYLCNNYIYYQNKGISFTIKSLRYLGGASAYLADLKSAFDSRDYQCHSFLIHTYICVIQLSLDIGYRFNKLPRVTRFPVSTYNKFFWIIVEIFDLFILEHLNFYKELENPNNE
jgi:hypothetical protein